MFILISILIAIAAFTYSEIITEPGEILSKPFQLLERLPEWLFKPLVGCCKCVAGQTALWLYPLYLCEAYDPIVHIWFVLQCVFNAAIIRAIYYKITAGAIPEERRKQVPIPPELKNLIQNERIKKN